jgi:hypothetical protein
MGESCSTQGKYKKGVENLVGKPEGRRRLGRSRRMWKDNIKTELRERGWKAVDWNRLSQDRENWLALGNTVVNLRVP